MRNNGTFAIQSTNAKLAGATWTTVALRGSGGNRLEVRVGAADVRFMVNGQTVRVMPINAGQLDGAPGVYVGSAGDVNVAGFTIEGAALRQSLLGK